MATCGQVVNLPGPGPSLAPAPAPAQPPDTPDGPGQPLPQPPQPHLSQSPERRGAEAVPAPGDLGPQLTAASRPPGPGPPLIRGLSRGSLVRPPPLGPGHPGAEFGGLVGPGVRAVHVRPPFFIREIYKNGFLKRLPYNERRSSALAKLMKSDRFWVVFSVHDDVLPFLELWHEPTEVASKPPVYVFPLAACQHISPSLIAADSEWSFVINFEMALAIRFSCGSREVMDDWVEVIRSKLGEMGILNPKGNLYSRAPLGPPVTKPVIRDPTSPLPQPPPVSAAASASEPAAAPSSTAAEATPATPTSTTAGAGAGMRRAEDTASTSTKPKRGSLALDTSSSSSSQSFTTSIYLNQSSGAVTPAQPPASSLIVSRKTSLPVTFTGAKPKLSPSKSSEVVAESAAGSGEEASEAVAISSSSAAAATVSSVYLGQASPTRHVTVIPINDEDTEAEAAAEEGGAAEAVEFENHTYGAIFDFDEKTISRAAASSSSGSQGQGEKEKSRSKENLKEAPGPSQQQQQARPDKERQRRPDQDISPRRGRDRGRQVAGPPLPGPPPGVLRRLSDRKVAERRQEVLEGSRALGTSHARLRRKSRRSSSLGPLLDPGQLAGAELGASTLSLESVDSNPRQAMARTHGRGEPAPRRTLQDTSLATAAAASPPRHVSELGGPGARPPPYHPLAHAASTFPPMIPLPGLTCQLSSVPPPPPVSLPPPGAAEARGKLASSRSLLMCR